MFGARPKPGRARGIHCGDPAGPPPEGPSDFWGCVGPAPAPVGRPGAPGGPPGVKPLDPNYFPEMSAKTRLHGTVGGIFAALRGARGGGRNGVRGGQGSLQVACPGSRRPAGPDVGKIRRFKPGELEGG